MPDEPVPQGGAEQQSEASAVYLRFREIFGGIPSRAKRPRPAKDQDGGASVPYGVGRDPRGLGNIVDALTAELGWSSPLAQSELMEGWVELAGEETAKHSTPVGISEGVLTVSCESTAWATQLRIMRADLMTRIALRFPDAGIQSIRFQGPEAPSWKRGPRSIPGRGPRDTYG
jgi:predicted nucleic acid-binding Zn ribbon protein